MTKTIFIRKNCLYVNVTFDVPVMKNIEIQFIWKLTITYEEFYGFSNPLFTNASYRG